MAALLDPVDLDEHACFSFSDSYEQNFPDGFHIINSYSFV